MEVRSLLNEKPLHVCIWVPVDARNRVPGLRSCILKRVHACLVYPTLLTSLNKHRRECLDCMGARALGPQRAGNELLMGMDVTDVYFCVHWTPAFQSYPLAFWRFKSPLKRCFSGPNNRISSTTPPL